MIYLDNASTTRIDPRVLDAMMPYLTDDYGNPGSIHSFGRNAAAAIARARTQVADFIGAKPEQIIFTSGGTEANNMVFRGLKNHLLKIGKTDIAVSPTEHDSVLRTAHSLEDERKYYKIKRGFHTRFFDADCYGHTHWFYVLDSVKRHPKTGLVSVMYVNNETGTINDIRSIAKVCADRGILFHTDCVQAAGSEAINVRGIKCDFLSLSSHKIHGPKGVGALFAADPSLLEPIVRGGAFQEFGLRGGTENVAGIVGFGAACEILSSGIDAERKYISDLRHIFISTLRTRMYDNGVFSSLSWNSHLLYGGSPKILNVRFNGIDAESLLLMLNCRDVCVSAGAACKSNKSEPSHVLKAMGLSDDEARQSIRISFSRMNTLEEVADAAAIIADSVRIISEEYDRI